MTRSIKIWRYQELVTNGFGEQVIQARTFDSNVKLLLKKLDCGQEMSHEFFDSSFTPKRELKRVSVWGAARGGKAVRCTAVAL